MSCLDNPDLLQTLITLEELRRDAWLKRDAKELRDLMAEDFMEINYFGRLTKADILDDLFLKLTLDRFTMEDFRVLTACDDAATLTYRCFEKITYEGSEVRGDFHVAATYALREGRWLLLLWQITPFNG